MVDILKFVVDITSKWSIFHQKSQNGDSCDAFSVTTNLLSLNQKSNKQQIKQGDSLLKTFKSYFTKGLIFPNVLPQDLKENSENMRFLRKFCGRYLVDKVLCGRYSGFFLVVDIR